MASIYFDAKLIRGYAKICHTGIIAINQKILPVICFIFVQ